jgi:hypothetical protein
MSNDEVIRYCPICERPLLRRDHKPGTVRIGGMSARDQGLPPFWWFCRLCDEYFDGVDITQGDGS